MKDWSIRVDICSTLDGSKNCLNLIRNKGNCTFAHECIAQCFAMIHNNRKPAGVLSPLLLQPVCLLRAPLLATWWSSQNQITYTYRCLHENTRVAEDYKEGTRTHVCMRNHMSPRPIRKEIRRRPIARRVQVRALHPLGICKISNTNMLISPPKNVRHCTTSTCCRCWTAAVRNNWFSKICVYVRCFVQCYRAHYVINPLKTKRICFI
jgi:hypothetical protein